MTGELFSKADLPKLRKPGNDWVRQKNICRSDYQLSVDNKPTGFWVRAAQHPTALRPYYVLTPRGEVLDRKFAHLDDAKAAAIAAYEESLKWH
jgi:hypothetical protein